MNLITIKRCITLRKMNSLIVLIILLLLFEHALLSALYLMGIINYSPSFQRTGRRLFLWLALHVGLSLYLFIRDKFRQKHRSYNSIRNDTQVQIASGIGIVLFVILHVLTYSYFPANINSMVLIHFIVDNLMFISILIHLQVSIPRLLISFGYLTKKGAYAGFVKKIRIILFALFMILFVSEIVHYIVAG